MIRDDVDVLKHAPRNLNIVVKRLSLYEHGTNERMDTQESNSDFETNEDCNEGTQLVGPVDGESKFENTKLEDLVLLEGPQQILQLTLQKRADDLMEEITDADDYADWIRWVADAEQEKQVISRAMNDVEVSVLLQVQHMDITDSHNSLKERLIDNCKADSRWGEICQNMRVDQNLSKEKGQQLWGVLEQY
jgi:hypothetical protein